MRAFFSMSICSGNLILNFTNNAPLPPPLCFGIPFPSIVLISCGEMISSKWSWMIYPLSYLIEMDFESSASINEISAVYIKLSGFSGDLLNPISFFYMILNTKFDGCCPGSWWPCPTNTIEFFPDLPASIYTTFVYFTVYVDCPSGVRIFLSYVSVFLHPLKS